MKTPERLCLIGMSGVGKSFHAKALEGSGWRRHDCDGEIAALAGIAGRAGEDPVLAVGRWMGMPWSEGYALREARYLELEDRATRACLERMLTSVGPHVLDATGSVICLNEALRARLREHALIVYLRAAGADELMLARYLHEPKPVVWGGLFSQEPGEEPLAALPRCYRRLLATRDARYLALAHVTVDAERLAKSGTELLAAIGDELR